MKKMKLRRLHFHVGCFGLIFYSKVTDNQAYEITADSLRALFEHLAQPELIRRVYFVDDSRKDFQHRLINILSSCVVRTCPDIEIVLVTDNGGIYNAVNRVWSLVEEEYVISFLSDFRMIQTVPLGVIVKAFKKYPELYLIYLRVRSVFGYNDAAKRELKKYPWYADYPDDEMETWYYRDECGRVYSLPYRLYLKQKAGSLPLVHWGGIELVPRRIDESNTLYTPKLPTKFFSTWPSHESFAGGPVILRTSIIKKYIPLPEEYRNRPAADCLETYFWSRDIDFKFYTGYLNLQAFAVPFGDPKRSLHEIQRKYWEEFRKRNSCPIVDNSYRPLILCELADIWTEPWGYHSVEICEFLVAHNYRWFSITLEGRLQLCPKKEHFHENLLAVPEEKLKLVTVFMETGKQCIQSP